MIDQITAFDTHHITHCRHEMYTEYHRAAHQIVRHQTALNISRSNNSGLSPAGHTCAAPKDTNETRSFPNLKDLRERRLVRKINFLERGLSEDSSYPPSIIYNARGWERSNGGRICFLSQKYNHTVSCSDQRSCSYWA